MRRQLLPPTCHQEKLVKLLQERFAPAFFAGQSFALSPPNLPLHGIFVEPTKDHLQLWTQVDGVKVESLGRSQSRWMECVGRSRTDLDVFPPFLCAIEFQGMEQAVHLFGAFDQRLAVVRERKRNHPPPGDPAIHATEK